MSSFMDEVKELAHKVEDYVEEHVPEAEAAAKTVEEAAQAIAPIVPQAGAVATVAGDVAGALAAASAVAKDVAPVVENVAHGDFQVPEGWTWERLAGDFRVGLVDLKELNKDVQLVAGAWVKLPK